jgi:hypothetical protein
MKQYVAKPQKVNAEQWTATLTPVPAGICTQAQPVGVCTVTPLFPDWRPHVHSATGVRELHEGDWITWSVVFPTHPPEVLTADEFTELYGPGGGQPLVPEGT